MMLSLRFSCTIIMVLTWATIGGAKTIEVTPDEDWFAKLTSDHVSPGDEFVLHGGIYSDSRRLVIRHRGTQDKPIVIRAGSGEHVVFKRPNANQNTFNLEGTQHLQLMDLEITGGAAAIRIGPAGDHQASDVLLDGLHIHHIGGVAITCNFEGADYQRMMFRRNHIHHTSSHGEAFYLGGNNATAIFSDSTIENNYIHHLNGPKVSQGDGVEIKHGSYGNRVVGNVIHDTQYPGITVYGTNGHDRNLIEKNLIWNTGDHGIQAAADAILRRNFIADADGCGIYSREHQGAIPGNLRIESNHVLATKNAAIRIIGDDAKNTASPIELIGNHLFVRGQHPALRVDNRPKLKASGNIGQGNIVGIHPSPDEWQVKSKPKTRLPTLIDNPVWRYQKRPDVEQRFSRHESVNHVR